MTYAFVLFTAHRYGYNAEQNGYLFFYVGVVAIIGQGVLFHRLVKTMGETKLTVIGCLLMAGSLLVFPFLGPAAGGLTALLAVTAVLSIGNAFASPSLTSLASKISPEDKQGTSLGIMQSGASLARAIGPLVGGVLLNDAMNRVSDQTVFRTFAAASGLMFVAMMVSLFAVKVMKGHSAVSTAQPTAR